MSAPTPGVGLEAVIRTAELASRPSRPRDDRTLAVALAALSQRMTNRSAILQSLVDSVMQLCRAQSAGISLLEEDGAHFYWPAVAGQWAAQAGGGAPREFGPCGTVLDRNAPQLFTRPERHFTYLAEAQPPIEEALLAPFYVEGEAMGTVWAISHDPRRGFDAEDLRALEEMASFTASAYHRLVEMGALRPEPPGG